MFSRDDGQPSLQPSSKSTPEVSSPQVGMDQIIVTSPGCNPRHSPQTRTPASASSPADGDACTGIGICEFTAGKDGDDICSMRRALTQLEHEALRAAAVEVTEDMEDPQVAPGTELA